MLSRLITYCHVAPALDLVSYYAGSKPRPGVTFSLREPRHGLQPSFASMRRSALDEQREASLSLPLREFAWQQDTQDWCVSAAVVR